jgi:hypothetical protein
VRSTFGARTRTGMGIQDLYVVGRLVQMSRATGVGKLPI